MNVIDDIIDGVKLMNENKGFKKGILCGIGISLLICLTVLVIWRFSQLSMAKEAGLIDQETTLNKSTIEKFDFLEDVIDTYYLNDVDQNTIREEVYKGLFNALDDPYSVYYTAEEYKSMKEAMSGIYCGIGAYLSQLKENNSIIISGLMEGSPAEESGLLPGDTIYMVDNTSISGMDTSQVVSLVKGEEGTTVTLTIYREGESDFRDITIERKQIETPTVSGEMLDDQIGLLSIKEFDKVTYEQFENELSGLQEQGMKSLIIDLRDNPGGDLDVVVNILDDVIPKGLAVYTVDKSGSRKEYNTKDDEYLKIPLAVLVNGNSASGSEVFSGAVKDYGTGTIVGTTTFGKGIVQTVKPFSDGSAIKLTISEYFTPKGNKVHEVGITPDIEVEFDRDAYINSDYDISGDNQLQKAIEILKDNK